MKAAIFVAFCFVNSILGLRCYNSVGKHIYGTKVCSSRDKYCAKMSIYDPYHLPQDFPMYFQGCSQELEEVYNVRCDGYGSYRVGGEIGMGEWHGNLYCCTSNLCNSASSGKVFGAVVLAIFVNLFVFVCKKSFVT